MKKVVISIINYNGLENTNDCLESLSRLDSRDLDVEVVVIDNASTTPFTFKNKTVGKFPLNIIHSSTNTGFSGGHNIGMQYALKEGADYILILNNDTIVDKGLVKHLVSAIEKESNIGIACPKIYFSPGSEYHKDKYDKKDIGKVLWYAGEDMDWKNILGQHRGVDEVDQGQYDKKEETEFATGCCMLVAMEVIKKIGMFDEKYFLYYEDTDFTMRAKNAGYKALYVPDAYLYHKNAASTGGSGSDLQDYFITRNRLLFGMKYAPLRSKLALIRESLLLLTSGRSGQKKGVRDFYQNKFKKGSFIND